MRVVLLAVLIVTPMLTSQARGDAAEPKPGWRETFLEKVPVSGRYVRVGVMQVLGGAPFDPEWASVVMPRTPYRSLCISITSLDGRYSADLEFDATALSPGGRTLHIPSKYLKDLRRLTPDTLALLARLTDGCNSSTAEFVVASWASIDSDAPIYVFLNSSVPAVLVDKSDPSRTFPCHFLKAPAIAYTLRCEVVATDPVPQRTFMINRSRRPGVSMSPIELPIIWR